MNEKPRIYVLTGRSSSGKTTIVRELEKRGYTVLHETAREVLEERKDYERTNEEWLYRQREMFGRQLKQEDEAIKRGGKIIFSDRGLPDVLAYCSHLIGYIPDELKAFDLRERYSGIFVPHKLPFKADGTRIEKDDGEVEEIHQKVIDSYRTLGYNPISVPVFPGNLEESVNGRIEFILDKIKNGN